MTRSQRARLRTVALARFSAALREAIPLVGQDETRVRAGLSQIWREALHQTLVEVGACPCVDQAEGCIAQQSESQLYSLFPSRHALGFDTFVEAFHKGAALASFALRPTSHTDTH